MKSITWICVILITLNSCNKFLDAARENDIITSEEAFGSDEMANAVAANIYAEMSATIEYPNGYLTRFMGLYSDELQRVTSLTVEPDVFYYKSQVLASDRIVQSLWSKPYSYIFQCNNILDNLENNAKVSEGMRSRLTGEAKFLRAMNYFYLLNLFGDVPELTEKNYRADLASPRQKKEIIWQLIIDDLLDAEQLLPLPSGNDGLSTGIRATRPAAQALLARVHLYRKAWQQAIDYADKVISSGYYKLETDLNKVFLYKSPEIIFQVQPSKSGNNTADALFFVSASTAPPLLMMRPELFKSFETGDLRLQYWARSGMYNKVEYYSPYKYKVRTSDPAEEYNIGIRLAEIYLIRAEAFAQLNQLQTAAADVGSIRKRAGLSRLPDGLSKQAMLLRIEQERRTELFAEWGHRWFDLKRTTSLSNPTQSRAEELINALKPGFSQNKLVLPVPQSELVRNANLTQNTGY